MIQQDTIQALSDSTNIVQDSLSKIDSLARMDSIQAVADSLKAIVHIPRGFLGIQLPSLPQTESWVFIVLLFLFFLLTYSISRSAGLFMDTLKTFFQVKERSSIFTTASITDFRFRLLLIIFSIGVLSLYVYLINYNSSTIFSIKEYGYFLIVTGLFFGLKSILFDLFGYVFLTPSNLKMAKDSYFNILSILGITLFPLLILQIYVQNNLVHSISIISLITSLSAGILVIIKLFQIFFNKMIASFYILLYLCTLEILPLIVLFRVYKLIV